MDMQPNLQNKKFKKIVLKKKIFRQFCQPPSQMVPYWASGNFLGKSAPFFFEILVMFTFRESFIKMCNMEVPEKNSKNGVFGIFSTFGGAQHGTLSTQRSKKIFVKQPHMGLHIHQKWAKSIFWDRPLNPNFLAKNVFEKFWMDHLAFWARYWENKAILTYIQYVRRFITVFFYTLLLPQCRM